MGAEIRSFRDDVGGGSRSLWWHWYELAGFLEKLVYPQTEML